MTTPSPNAADPTSTSGGWQPSKKNRRHLAIAGVFLGALTIFGALSGGDGGTNAAIGNVLLGIAFLIPSLWWFHCENADQGALQAYQEAMKVRGQNRTFVNCARHDPSSWHGRIGKAQAEEPALEISRSAVCCPFLPGHSDHPRPAGSKHPE